LTGGTLRNPYEGIYRQHWWPVAYPDEYRLADDLKKFLREPIIVPYENQEEFYRNRLAASTTQIEGITRMYVRGSSYHRFEQFRLVHRLTVPKGGSRRIEIRLANGETTYVRIVDVSGNTDLTQGIVNTCTSVFTDPDFKNGHVRKGEIIGDLGRMATVGRNWNEYQNYPTIRDSDHALQSLDHLGKMTKEFRSMMEEHFYEELQEILAAEEEQEKDTVVVEEMSGLGSAGQMTENQGGASHRDLDKSRSVAVWVAGNPGDPPRNWYFMFPFTEIDGRMVVIPLFHGCAVSWDARVLQHCTSTTENVGMDDKNAYAFMIGSSASKKGPPEKQPAAEKESAAEKEPASEKKGRKAYFLRPLTGPPPTTKKGKMMI
jgi:hypothetical protein